MSQSHILLKYCHKSQYINCIMCHRSGSPYCRAGNEGLSSLLREVLLCTTELSDSTGDWVSPSFSEVRVFRLDMCFSSAYRHRHKFYLIIIIALRFNALNESAWNAHNNYIIWKPELTYGCGLNRLNEKYPLHNTKQENVVMYSPIDSCEGHEYSRVLRPGWTRNCVYQKRQH